MGENNPNLLMSQKFKEKARFTCAFRFNNSDSTLWRGLPHSITCARSRGFFKNTAKRNTQSRATQLKHRTLMTESGICPAPCDYLGHKASLVQNMSDTTNNCLLCLPPHMLSSLSILDIRCLIMCSECRLHFYSRLWFVTKQEIEFFPCADIVSYFLLLLLVCY